MSFQDVSNVSFVAKFLCGPTTCAGTAKVCSAHYCCHYKNENEWCVFLRSNGAMNKHPEHHPIPLAQHTRSAYTTFCL